MLKGLLHAGSKQLVHLIEILAVLFAILLGAIYFISTEISNRQSEVSGWLTESIGYPVEVGEIDLKWPGLMPEIRVQNVVVHPTTETVLQAGEAGFGFNIYESLKQWQPVFSQVKVKQVALALTRQADGAIQLAGKTWQPNATTERALPPWLQSLQNIVLSDIKLTYTDEGQPHLSGDYLLDHAYLKQVSNGWLWQSELNLPPALGRAIGFHGRLSTAANTPLKTNWELVGKQLTATSLKGLAIQGITWQQGIADVHLRGTATEWQPQTIQGQVSLSNAQLASEGNPQYSPVTIAALNGQFDWQQQADSWQLKSDLNALQIEDEIWPVTHWEIMKKTSGEILFLSNILPLKGVLAIAGLSESLPEAVQAQLLGQRPAGILRDIDITYHPEQGITQANIELDNVGVLPWQKTPGIAGLTGSLNMDAQSGDIQLNSVPLTLTQAGKPVSLDIVGAIHWQTTDQTTVWRSNALQLKNVEMDLVATGTVTQQGDDIINDIEVDMTNINVVNWQDYVDVSALDPDFYEWANEAFVAGTISSGKLIWQGSLAEFPYDKAKQEGLFEVKLDAEKVRLHYAPGWPDLTKLAGTVHIKNNTLTVNSKQGNISGFVIDKVTAKITNLTNRRAQLKLTGTTHGKTEQVFEFLQTSPLKSEFGAYIAGVQSSGNTAIDLGLDIPLANAEQTQANGTARFTQSTLLRPDLFDVPITDIQGSLMFSNSGLTAQGLQGKLLDTPVLVDVATVSEDGQTVTTVDAQGKLTAAKVAKVLGQPLPEFITGEAVYKVKVAIKEVTAGEFEVSSTIRSDLVGLAIEMPAPVGKASDQKQDFQAEIVWSQNGAAQYTGNYGDIMALVAQNQADWRGEIRLGSHAASLPENGWRLRGQWPELAITPWQVWLDKQTKKETTLAIEDIAVEFGKLSLAGHSLHDVSLSTHKAAKTWVVQLSSNEVAGKIHWPISGTATHAVEANLKYLHLTLPEDVDTEIAEKTIYNQDLWPTINLNCENLTVDDYKLGEVDLKAHRNPTTWILDSLSLIGPAHEILASGRWEKTANSNNTALLVSGESEDGEALLNHFGFQPAIRTQSVDVGLDLTWPGSPISFSRENINGKMSIDIGQGQLLDVEPGAAGRVFGLLSFTALPRRLSLDFSDLFGQGFSFDTIKGRFKVADGNAIVDNSRMRGPTADIQITGRIGLLAEDYDQQIIVTPNLSSSLPLAGAAAGGAVGLGVGTAVLLADKAVNKLFGGNIINLISYQYDLTGTWDKPVFSAQQVNEQAERTREIQHTIGNQ